MKNFVSVAIDPQNPDIVYASRGIWLGRRRMAERTGTTRAEECLRGGLRRLQHHCRSQRAVEGL